MRTGEWVVQLEGVEYLGSWEMSTGDFVVWRGKPQVALV